MYVALEVIGDLYIVDLPMKQIVILSCFFLHITLKHCDTGTVLLLFVNIWALIIHECYWFFIHSYFLVDLPL